MYVSSPYIETVIFRMPWYKDACGNCVPQHGSHLSSSVNDTNRNICDLRIAWQPENNDESHSRMSTNEMRSLLNMNFSFIAVFTVYVYQSN